MDCVSYSSIAVIQLHDQDNIEGRAYLGLWLNKPQTLVDCKTLVQLTPLWKYHSGLENQHAGSDNC